MSVFEQLIRPVREVIDTHITGYYIDRDLMRGSLWVHVEMAGQTVHREFRLKEYDHWKECLADAQRWRDTILSLAQPQKPVGAPKRVRLVSAAVELAQRDVAHARARYGHTEDPWWSERSYVR